MTCMVEACDGEDTVLLSIGPDPFLELCLDHRDQARDEPATFRQQATLVLEEGA